LNNITGMKKISNLKEHACSTKRHESRK